MERKIYKELDNNSKLVKRFRSNYKRLWLWFIDLFILGLGPIMFTNVIFDCDASVSVYIVCIILVILYEVITCLFAFFDNLTFKKIKDLVVVKEKNNIYMIRTDFITYEIGLMERQMNDDEVFNYSQNNFGRIPTDEEINKVLLQKPEGFYVDEYNNCKFIKETKDYYEFSGINSSNGVLENLKIYKIYFNIKYIVEEGE